jgi:hypothetical protein
MPRLRSAHSELSVPGDDPQPSIEERNAARWSGISEAEYATQKLRLIEAKRQGTVQ